MNKSESIAQLATALSQAQGELHPAKMSATNPFLKNKYADLGEIIQSSRPALSKYGLAISQHASAAGGNISVETVLMHKSGEWLSSTIDLPIGEEKGRSLAQSAGAIITYLRRYSYSAIVGIYADEDTDGSEKGNGNKQEPKPAQPTQPKTESKPENGFMPLSQKLVELKIVENEFHATAALKLLECNGLPEDQQIARVRIYRAWRDKDEPKESAKAKAIAGELPA